MVNRLALFDGSEYGLDDGRHQFDTGRPSPSYIGDITAYSFSWNIVLYKCRIHEIEYYVTLWGNRTGEW